MKSLKFKITLHNKNGEVISTSATKQSMIPLALEFLEAMSKGNKTITKVSIEVA